MLNKQRITNNFEYMEKLKQMNIEAFPEKEREEIDTFIEYSVAGVCDFWAFFDDDIFIGFTLLAKNGATAYLCFFAVDSNLRSKGYGSKILSLLKKAYQGKQIIVDLERTDEECSNIVERISRKMFYLRNGFKDTGYILFYGDMTYDVLYSGDLFDKESYTDLFTIIKETNDNIDLLKR